MKWALIFAIFPILQLNEIQKQKIDLFLTHVPVYTVYEDLICQIFPMLNKTNVYSNISEFDFTSAEFRVDFDVHWM